MATQEFIQNRITKAEENVSKKTALIEKMKTRIGKNVEKLQKLGFTQEDVEVGIQNPFNINRDNENWRKGFDLVNSIGNAMESIESAMKAVEELNQKLEGYRSQLQDIIEKDNSRDIKIILDFLEVWKTEAKSYYESHVNDWVTSLWLYQDARQTKDKDAIAEAKERHDEFKFMNPYMERQSGRWVINTDKLQKDLNAEAIRKYDFIIERTKSIVEVITDASNLSIGDKGDLNGFIIGTKGVAEVRTIGAGGHNIQCFHFRTIINRMK